MLLHCDLRRQVANPMYVYAHVATERGNIRAAIALRSATAESKNCAQTNNCTVQNTRRNQSTSKRTALIRRTNEVPFIAHEKTQ
jgi:hypothetical protein